MLITFGIVIGYLVAINRAKRYKIKRDDIDNLILFVLPASIIGARIYHIISEWGYYRNNLGEIFSLRMNGLGIFGVILAALLVIYIYSKKKQINFSRILDLFSPSLLIGQVIGRFGNYFNHELYGYPTGLPWKIYIPLENRFAGYESSEYFHPTFLYESIWNLIGFGIILLIERTIFRKNKYCEGIIFSLYLIWYGIGRFIIGFVRIEERDFWILNDGQIMAVLSVLIGLGIFLFANKNVRQNANQKVNK